MEIFNKLFLVMVIVCAIVITGLPTVLNAQTVKYETPVRDSDYDGLTDQGENQIYKTDPQKDDTDNDGYIDGAEILAGTNPLVDEALILENMVKDIPWPWYVARISAIVGYLLLFLLIVSGIGIKTSYIFKFISPTISWVNHRLIGIALTVAVVVHIIALYLDKFSKFTIADLLIPYASSFKPFYMSLGIIGLYLLIVIIISSIFFIDKFAKKWRLLHYLTYVLFLTIAVHGFFIGTDSDTLIMRIVYFSTGIIVSLLALYRLLFFYKQVR